MSQQNAYTRHHTIRTDVKPQSNKLLDDYMKYIVAAVPKIPYSCRFSRIVSRLKIYSGSAGKQNEREHKLLCNFLHSVCLMCKDWHKKDRVEKDIVHVLVHIPREMRRLEETIDDICHEMGILPQPGSAEDIEQDERMDWGVQIEKTQGVLSHHGFRDKCLALEGRDAEGMMQVMQKILIQSLPDNPDRIHAFKILNGLSKQCKRFVTVKTVRLDGNEEYVASGGFGSISKALYSGTQVAVKAIVLYSRKDNSSAERMLRREILLWNLITQQHHPHILPLIGITDSQFPSIKMVAPWQENGNLSDYVQQPAATKINRLRLLAQVCSALQYLHNHVPIVIHADLKCANVLVNRNGNPCLADFGLATVRHNGATMTSALEGGSTRWMAPELFMVAETDTNEQEEGVSTLKVTRFSDIWSFAMLALELLTDERPFPDKILDPAVICALMKNERPKHPRSPKVVAHGLNHEMWQYLCCCWESSPEKRLPLQSLYTVLDKLATQWHPASPDGQDHQSRVTETLSVPANVYGKIVGSYGMNVRRYESELNVKIKLVEQRVLITGLPENVQEARTIIESLVERHVDKVQKTIGIPSHLHGYLIGSGGVRIREFQEKHHVTVSLDRPSDQATVRGSEKNVDRAIEELQQAVNLDKEWAPTLKLRVTKRAAQRLYIEKSSIVHSTGLDVFIIQETDDDRHKVVMIRGKHPDALDKAKRVIQQICREVQNESELELKIPTDLHGLILGTQWKTWSDLVLRCGGPDNPKLQNEIIQIDRNSEQVFLRGQADLINALAKEIQITIDKTKLDVHSMLISPRYHPEVGRSIGEIQRKTGALILIPGDGKYDEFNDPAEMSNEDPKSVVKIIGTRDAYTQAYAKLDAKVRDIQRTQLVLQIPLKYQHAIFVLIQRRLREMGVQVSFSVANRNESPIRPIQDGRDWQVIERYNSYIDGISEWTLRSAAKDALDQAQTLIEKAFETASRAMYVGFLDLPDTSKFGRIIGRNGETIQKLQHDTNTTILVPRMNEKDHTIEITGSAQDIEVARVRIEELVNNDPPSPTDRLFKSSRMATMSTSAKMEPYY